MESDQTRYGGHDNRPAESEPFPSHTDTERGVLEAPFKFGRRKLAFGGAVFVLLTIGIFAYQFGQIQSGDATPAWDRLRWRFVVPILLLLPVESCAAALRIWIASRVLYPDLGIWTCLKAELSNVAVSTLTPSQTGGGPAQIYILSRAGMKVGGALTISLVSFMGTMAALFFIGVYGLLMIRSQNFATPFITALAAFLLTASLMALAALWPAIVRIPLAAFSRLLCTALKKRHALQDWWRPGISRHGPPTDRMGPTAGQFADLVYSYQRDVGRFLSEGKRNFVWICSLSGVIFAARALMPYFCLRFLGAKTVDPRDFVSGQLALIFLIFFAPTPGAAGWAEGSSMMLFADLIPAGVAPLYNLLWRLVSLYVPASVGLVVLARSLAHDMSGAVAARRTRCSSTTHAPDNLSNSDQWEGRIP